MKTKTKVKKINADDLEQEFESLWRIYPNKQGKLKAKESFEKARKRGTTYNEIIMGLERYLRYCNRTEWYSPKMGSTWFNQNCWLDEIDEGEFDNKIVKDKFGNIIL